MDAARDLADRLAFLFRREQGALADFLLALADFDRRRLWEPLGYSGLFHFLHRHLGMSKGAAHYRKTAAALVQRVPEVLEPLRAGTLCITSIIELAKVLTPENQEEVLPRFFHCSKREAQAISAEIAPMEAAPHRTVVTALPAVTARTAEARPAVLLPQAPATLVQQERPCAPSIAVQPVEPEARIALAPAPRIAAEPLTADLRRLHVTVSKRFMEKLEAARDALSHSHPGADVEAILEAGLDQLLERAAKRRGRVKRPRAQAKAPRDDGDPRRIPAAVSREVFLRDDSRCQWPTAGGGICGSTHRVELDHIVPVGRGGRSSVSNLRVLCDVHNHLAARQVYGDEWMGRFRPRASNPEMRPPLAEARCPLALRSRSNPP